MKKQKEKICFGKLMSHTGVLFDNVRPSQFTQVSFQMTLLTFLFVAHLGEFFKAQAIPPPINVEYRINSDRGDELEASTTFGMTVETPVTKRLLLRILQYQQATGASIAIFLLDTQPFPHELALGLQAYGIDFHCVIVDHRLNDAFKARRRSYLDHYRAQWRDVINQPVQSTDWTMSILMASVNAASAAYIWIVKTELDPALALLLTASQSTATFYITRHLSKFDAAWRKKWNSYNPDEGVGMLSQVFRRQLYFTIPFAELWRVMSGPVGEAHSAFSWIGQAEVLSNALAAGIGGAVFAATRNIIYADDPITRRWMNLNSFVLMAPLVGLDLAGIHFATVADWGFYQLHASTLAILAGYLGMAAGVAFIKPVRHVFQNLSHWEEGAGLAAIRFLHGAKKAAGCLFSYQNLK